MAGFLGGFSPTNAVKQFGSVVNPTGGVTNYDVFTNVGNQQTANNSNGGFADSLGGTATALQNQMHANVWNNGGREAWLAEEQRKFDQEAAQHFAKQDSTYGFGGGGSGGSGSPAYNAQDLAYLDQQKSLYERLLGDTDTFQRQAKEKLDTNYANSKKGAERNYGRVTGGYDQQEYDAENNKAREINRVDTNSRTLNDSLRKILGMASGSGSSAFQYAAPSAVARAASGERGNVMDSYSRNMGDLSNARKESEEDYASLLDELLGSYNDNKLAQGTGFAQQRQGLNNSLAQIASDRASLMGGNPLAAAQPYRDQFGSLQDKIVGMGDNYKTQIDTREVAARPVTLRDYIADRQAINANNQYGQADNSPYAQFLNKQREEERNI